MWYQNVKTWMRIAELWQAEEWLPKGALVLIPDAVTMLGYAIYCKREFKLLLS